MNQRRLTVDQRLALVKFEVDKKPHINIKKDRCRRCSSRPCVSACPAGLYSVDENGELHFNYEGCLECGTCRIVCPHGAVEWSYPRGGFGVWFQFG